MKISLRRHHTIFLEILNPGGCQNRITDSRVTAILLNGWIFPIGQSGEASRCWVCYQRGLPFLVQIQCAEYISKAIFHTPQFCFVKLNTLLGFWPNSQPQLSRWVRTNISHCPATSPLQVGHKPAEYISNFYQIWNLST